jgi:hypothetical protein
MLGSLERFDDNDLPVPDHAVAELRQFFRQWQRQLLAEPAGVMSRSSGSTPVEVAGQGMRVQAVSIRPRSR